MFVDERSLVLSVDGQRVTISTVLKGALWEAARSWSFTSVLPAEAIAGPLVKGSRVPLRPEETPKAVSFSEVVEYQETSLPAAACFYCGAGRATTKMQTDHVTPTARSGVDNAQNKVTACRRCNQLKFDRTYEEFRHDVAQRKEATALPTFFGELPAARRLLWYSFEPGEAPSDRFSTSELNL